MRGFVDGNPSRRAGLSDQAYRLQQASLLKKYSARMLRTLNEALPPQKTSQRITR